MRNITRSIKGGVRPLPSGRRLFESLEKNAAKRLTSLKPGGKEISLNIRVAIQGFKDIVKARCAGRLLVQEIGFSNSQAALVITAISELARNIILYARVGEIVLSRTTNGSRIAAVVTAIDKGPGIADLQSALAGGFSTSGGLGLGLCGLRHIVDDFKIQSQIGKGTQVTVKIRSW